MSEHFHAPEEHGAPEHEQEVDILNDWVPRMRGLLDRIPDNKRDEFEARIAQVEEKYAACAPVDEVTEDDSDDAIESKQQQIAALEALFEEASSLLGELEIESGMDNTR